MEHGWIGTLVGCSDVSEKVSTSQNNQQNEPKNNPAENDQEKIGNADDIAITVYKSPTCGYCTEAKGEEETFGEKYSKAKL